MIVPGGGISLDGKRWVTCRWLLSAGARALAPVPTAVPGEASRRIPGQPPEVLRRSCPSRRCSILRDLLDAAAQGRVGRLHKDTVRRAKDRAGLSVALCPPRRHRQQPADRLRPHRRHLPMEGLPRRRSGSPEGHDPRHRRVHPQIPDPRPAHGFHRIRHYGLLASGTRADNIARARRLLNVPIQPEVGDTIEPKPLSQPCPFCGGRMIIIEMFQRGCSPRYRPDTSTAMVRIDTS